MSNPNDSIDLVIAKVEKLWRQANHPGTGDAERAVFEAKALALMESHRITEQMLDLGYEDVIGDWELVKLTGRNARLAIDLAVVIAEAYDSRIYWNGYGLSYDVMVFGYKSDFERVKLLFNMLNLDMWAQAANEKGVDMANTKELRRSFVIGYRRAIAARLREAKLVAATDVMDRREAEIAADEDREDDILDLMVNDGMEYEEAVSALAKAESAGTALVFVERGKQVSAKYAQKSMRHAAGTRGAGNHAAAQRGLAAGRNASLSQRGAVGRTPALAR